jgi:hypothetical protein
VKGERRETVPAAVHAAELLIHGIFHRMICLRLGQLEFNLPT